MQNRHPTHSRHRLALHARSPEREAARQQTRRQTGQTRADHWVQEQVGLRIPAVDARTSADVANLIQQRNWQALDERLAPSKQLLGWFAILINRSRREFFDASERHAVVVGLYQRCLPHLLRAQQAMQTLNAHQAQVVAPLNTQPTQIDRLFVQVQRVFIEDTLPRLQQELAEWIEAGTNLVRKVEQQRSNVLDGEAASETDAASASVTPSLGG